MENRATLESFCSHIASPIRPSVSRIMGNDRFAPKAVARWRQTKAVMLAGLLAHMDAKMPAAPTMRFYLKHRRTMLKKWPDFVDRQKGFSIGCLSVRLFKIFRQTGRVQGVAPPGCRLPGFASRAHYPARRALTEALPP